MNKEWSEQNKTIQKLLGKETTSGQKETLSVIPGFDQRGIRV